MQNVDYEAAYDRALFDALYVAEGVIDGFVVSPVSGLQIAVTGGRAVVQGDEVAGQGKYLVDQDATVNLTLASVGANRTEYVYIAINDPAVSGGRAGNNVTIETSTSPPPNSALLIATLTLTLGTVTITAPMIADSRVITSAVADGSVVTGKIAASAVTTPKIADDAVTTPKIAGAAVTEIKIATDAVSATKIAANAVTTAKILDGNVTLAKLSAALQATIDAIDPADAIIMIGGSTAPAGWGLCDGSAVSRATYAATFARIGTAHGVGDGSTTFNVPDMRNRFPVGKGPLTWSDAVAESGGSKDAALVYHNHSANTTGGGAVDHLHGAGSYVTTTNGTHGHGLGDGSSIPYYNPAGWATVPGGGGTGLSLTTFTHDGAHSHSVTGQSGPADRSLAHDHGVSVNHNGVSATDANLPPYRVLNFCIRLR